MDIYGIRRNYWGCMGFFNEKVRGFLNYKKKDNKFSENDGKFNDDWNRNEKNEDWKRIWYMERDRRGGWINSRYINDKRRGKIIKSGKSRDYYWRNYRNENVLKIKWKKGGIRIN